LVQGELARICQDADHFLLTCISYLLIESGLPTDFEAGRNSFVSLAIGVFVGSDSQISLEAVSPQPVF
jgi:hypothetical protein